MVLKHLIVHVDSSDRTPARVRLAIEISRRSRARLTGLFVQPSDLAARRASAHLPSWSEAAQAARARFREEAQAAGVDSGWWTIPDGEFDVSGIAARYFRYGDLALVGQRAPGDHVPGDFAERAVLESGRPVLVVPPGSQHVEIGRRVVFAWDGSREATRAMNDALPLLDGVERATVALLHGDRDRVALDDESTPSVLRQLHCHGIAASYEALPTDLGSDGLSPTDALLNLAFDLTADLVVMGARGRHGSPFPRAESRTREGLAAMAAPMLVSM